MASASDPADGSEVVTVLDHVTPVTTDSACASAQTTGSIRPIVAAVEHGAPAPTGHATRVSGGLPGAWTGPWRGRMLTPEPEGGARMSSSTRSPRAPVGVPADRGDQLTRVVAGAAGVVLVGLGLWAFTDPGSFYDAVATFEPRNDHFVRDIGAFQIGLGAVLLLALVWRDALTVTLVGVGVGTGFHAVAHVLDRDLGGSPATDIPTFAIVAVLLLVAGARRASRT
jgi:hypothetical protein